MKQTTCLRSACISNENSYLRSAGYELLCFSIRKTSGSGTSCSNIGSCNCIRNAMSPWTPSASCFPRYRVGVSIALRSASAARVSTLDAFIHDRNSGLCSSSCEYKYLIYRRQKTTTRSRSETVFISALAAFSKGKLAQYGFGKALSQGASSVFSAYWQQNPMLAKLFTAEATT